MNALQKIARLIIKKSFVFSVWTIERFNDMKYYEEKVKRLRQYPSGTLGYDIARRLDDNNLTLVPGFESHDLKHVLLDYKMTPVDEIRMQAFMLGNGNYTLPCLAILIFGMLLLPDEWSTFYKDFKRGRISRSVFDWTIEEYAYLQTSSLQQRVITVNHYKQLAFTMRTITKIGAITAIAAGVFGMLFCLPFLFSSDLADLIGAGFPFVGGAILAAGGLLSLSNLTKHKMVSIPVNR